MVGNKIETGHRKKHQKGKNHNSVEMKTSMDEADFFYVSNDNMTIVQPVWSIKNFGLNDNTGSIK